MVHENSKLHIGSTKQSTQSRILANYSLPHCLDRKLRQGCFDRIIPSIAAINCRRHGAPKTGCITLAKVWTQPVHSIKTSHGISITTYSALPMEYHAGAGQGSCLAPLIQNTISTQILNITSDRPTLEHANNQDPITRQSKAYVDDTSFMVNLSHQTLQDPAREAQILAHRITRVAQCTERTLYASGGALELSKCAWYAILWQWDAKGKASMVLHNQSVQKCN